MKKNLISKILVIALSTFVIVSLQFAFIPSVSALAQASPADNEYCSKKILLIPSWSEDLAVIKKDGDQTTKTCYILNPNEFPGGLNAFIVKIITNITQILLSLIGYLAVGFVLYGSFILLTSSGRSEAVAKGRQTIVRALIGMVIGIGGSAIVGTIYKTIFPSGYVTNPDANTVLGNIFDLVLQLAAVTTIIIIVVSGFKIVTGGDNPEKIQSARKAIIYALIGLILVVSSYSIVKFVVGKL